MHAQPGSRSSQRRVVVPVLALVLALALSAVGAHVASSTSIRFVHHQGGANGVALVTPPSVEMAEEVSRSVGLMEGAPAEAASIQLNDVLDIALRSTTLAALGASEGPVSDAVAVYPGFSLCRNAC